MRKTNNNGLIAGLISLLGAFVVPIQAVNWASNLRYSGAVVYTTGLKNLGMGDMGMGIGVCGLIGVGSALLIGLLTYLLLVKVRGRN